MRALLIGAVTAALAACAPQSAPYTPSPTAGAISGGPGYSYRTERPVGTAAPNTTAADAAADCERQYDQHKLKTATAAVQCFHSRLREAGSPLNDNDHLLMAKQLELAEKVDHRRLTKAEAKLQFAEYAAAMRDRLANRAAQSATVEQGRQQTQAQIYALERQAQIARQAEARRSLNDVMTNLRASQQYYVPTFPRTSVTCTHYGNTSTCN
jgi:hypothetical protein